MKKVERTVSGRKLLAPPPARSVGCRQEAELKILQRARRFSAETPGVATGIVSTDSDLYLVGPGPGLS